MGTTIDNLLRARYGKGFASDGASPELINGTIETILQHRSVRSYAKTPIDSGVLEVLVAAAQSASTSSNLQCYSIIAVTDEAHKAELSVLCGKQQQIIDAPLFLVFCADLYRLKAVCELTSGPSEGLDYAEMFVMSVIDATLAAQNLVVAAESLGLGTCYIGGARNHPKALASNLKLPPKVFAVFGLTVGYPLERTEHVKPRLAQSPGILHREVYSTDYRSAVDDYEETMLEFNDGEPGRSGRGWLDPTARRVGTAQALGAERSSIKDFLTEIEMDLR